jgi:hypothetical protein
MCGHTAFRTALLLVGATMTGAGLRAESRASCEVRGNGFRSINVL